jgi:hypothetical protein
VTGTASAPTAVVPTRPLSRSAPSIAGRPRVGARLTGGTGSWSGPPVAFRYRWVRCRDAGCRRGPTVGRARTYRVREADRGRRLVLSVTATNAVGRTTASSLPTSRVR